MKITVISDSHRNYHGLKQIVAQNSDSDTVIHLGDGIAEAKQVSGEFPDSDFVCIRGNCDYSGGSDEVIVEAGGYRIFCTHGHCYYVRSGLRTLIDHAKIERCDIVLYGHTHLHKAEIIDGIRVMNPGSITEPRGGNAPTYGIIRISEAGEITMKIEETE
jgi:hypothetical protein